MKKITEKKLKKKEMNTNQLQAKEVVLTISFLKEEICLKITTINKEEHQIDINMKKEEDDIFDVVNVFEVMNLKRPYKQSIHFDNNEIIVGEKTNGVNVVSGFFSNVLIEPNQPINYHVKYQHQHYKFSTEEIVALYFYQFKKYIEQRWIIKETIVELPKKLECLKKVIVKGLFLIQLNKIKINNTIMTLKNPLTEKDKEKVNEVIQKHQNYLQYKYQIERMQRIMKKTNDTTHPELMDHPNNTYTPTKLEEIKKTLTSSEKTKYRLYKLDNKNCLFEASKWFERVNDFINLAMVSRKAVDLMELYKYNPITITASTINLFNNIDVQHIYSRRENIINLGQIQKFVVLYRIGWQEYKQMIKKTPLNKTIEFKTIIYGKKDSSKDFEKGKRKNMGGCDYKHDFVLNEKIVEIDQKCFERQENINSIVIPSSVTKIGNQCFSGCDLKELIIPETVKIIDKECFKGCFKLTNIVIPSNQTRFVQGNKIFTIEHNQLNIINLESTIKQINGNEVEDITHLVVPNSITSIEKTCFEKCPKIKSLTLPDTISYLDSQIFSSCQSLIELILPSSLIEFSANSFSALSKLETLTISPLWKNQGKRLYREHNGCLYSLHLPLSIKTINKEIVSSSTKIIIPSTVTKLSDYCFAHCLDLQEIEGIENVKEFGIGCFYHTPLLDRENYPVIWKNDLEQNGLTDMEINYICQWTECSLDQVVFDSNQDNWSKHTSVLNEKIIAKDHLLFLIETEDGEKFGYFCPMTIQPLYYKRMPVNKYAFSFTLKSNGRIQNPTHFNIINDINGGYELCDKSDNYNCLIRLGDIWIYFKEFKTESCCNETKGNFNYHHMTNALCGSTPDKCGWSLFDPKRILVIQLK